MSTLKHLPECTTVAASDIARKHGHEDPERFATIRFMKCADGCPDLERAIQRGRELAERYGW